MTDIALALVLFSGFAHAFWNLLLKRSDNQEIFVWWIQITQIILLSPLALYLIMNEGIQAEGWWFILGTSVIHILYFVFLSRGYMNADFSLVYPIARGMGPALIPILGVIFLKETVSELAIWGIVTIIVGIFTVYWWGHLFEITKNFKKIIKDRGIRYALLTGITIAAYSVWDKVGIQYVDPLLYMYMLALGTAVGLLPYIFLKYAVGAVKKELLLNKTPILFAGILVFIAYGSVLSAMQLSNVSYVAPAREIGIVYSVILARVALGEHMNMGRVLGSLAIISGVFLIAIG